ncbi:MAG: hypothetical protein M1819_003942 [Sarea resinae]|nr:MAG: hypothetical protein M1819_003942 [Sarea resinae]
MNQLRRKNLLIAFDAFGTLFTPGEPIAKQYGDVARRCGMTSIDSEALQSSFSSAFKAESRRHPNFGKEMGMQSFDWWGNIIKSTFRPFLREGQQLPERLVPELLRRFSTSEGYDIYPDVIPFLRMIRNTKQNPNASMNWPWDLTVVGVITNTDNRVPGVLRSLGLEVGPRMIGQSGSRTQKAHVDEDISFVTLSYDVGAEKPDQRIFDAAKTLLQETLDSEGLAASAGKHDGEQYSGPSLDAEDFVHLFVGDDLEKDILGAQAAGWNGVLVDRKGAYAGFFREGQKIIRISTDTRKPAKAGSKGDVLVIQDFFGLQDWSPSELE